MSTEVFIYSAYSRASIVHRDGTVWIRTKTTNGMTVDSVALTLTSRDRDALIAALHAVDTSRADEDAGIEVAA